jgi:hypothetical protein
MFARAQGGSHHRAVATSVLAALQGLPAAIHGTLQLDEAASAGSHKAGGRHNVVLARLSCSSPVSLH